MSSASAERSARPADPLTRGPQTSSLGSPKTACAASAAKYVTSPKTKPPCEEVPLLPAVFVERWLSDAAEASTVTGGLGAFDKFGRWTGHWVAVSAKD